MDPGGHIGDLHELIHEETLNQPFLIESRGVEPVLEQVLTLAAHLRDIVATAVMVGEHQSVRRNEGRRALSPVAPQGSEVGVLEPCFIGLEPVRLREPLHRRSVKGPHPAGVEPSRLNGIGIETHRAENLGKRRECRSQLPNDGRIDRLGSRFDHRGSLHTAAGTTRCEQKCEGNQSEGAKCGYGAA